MDRHALSVGASYDQVAAEYATALPDVAFEAPLDHAMLDEFVAQVGAGAAVLDAGCGSGRLTAHLATHGLEVTGLDVSAKMVAQARQSHPDLRFDRGSLGELPYDDASFLGVVAWYSLIHTPPSMLADTLAELGRVLQPGGRLLIGFHAGRGVRHVTHAYGRDVSLDVALHDLDDMFTACVGSGLAIHARMERAPREHEQNPQAFVIAVRG